MCGIAGYIHKSGCTDFCHDLGKKVQELQACRGPDNHTTTTFLNESWTTHFYHQHLRIVDLNPLANQPMRSNIDHALSIIFNGSNLTKFNALFFILFKNAPYTDVVLAFLSTDSINDANKKKYSSSFISELFFQSVLLDILLCNNIKIRKSIFYTHIQSIKIK